MTEYYMSTLDSTKLFLSVVQASNSKTCLLGLNKKVKMLKMTGARLITVGERSYNKAKQE